ncbi:MAG: serine/threonine-protein kinase, partial [Planctomycetota bacterium]
MPHDESPTEPFDQPTEQTDTEHTSSEGPSFGEGGPVLEAGTQVGGYTVDRLLGQGGMGAVYLAEQDRPQRKVALKLMRPGLASAEALRRFEHEAELLGRLQHPGVAQIHEAGLHEGAPFFAMEFVDGLTLTAYANRHALSVSARLKLFTRVCEAVHHAHTKGVIHRDLKPANILVTEVGEPPEAPPKVLDFGVARATDADVQAATMRTDVGQLIGTIPYMSPEQVGGVPGDLDTRSDVYALGVVLYELLVGRLPYDLKDRLILEAARVIREEDPTRLSSLDTRLRGDVETIVGKALEKERDRRYQSALDLGSDIRRYLSDEPIAARPVSTWYQVRKFSKRNTALVAGVGVAFGALGVGLVGTTYGLVEANAQRELADARAVEAEEARESAEAARAEEAERAGEVEKVAAFQSSM